MFVRNTEEYDSRQVISDANSLVCKKTSEILVPISGENSVNDYGKEKL